MPAAGRNDQLVGRNDESLETLHRFIYQDARDLNHLSDQSVDLIVTSPPYPMIEMWDRQFVRMNSDTGLFLKKNDYRGAHEAMHRVLDRVWLELYRVMKEGAYACINIGDATRTINGRFRLFVNHARIQMKFIEIGFDALPLILWRKQTNAPTKFMGSGMLPAGAYVTLEHEYILIFRKGNRRRFETAEEKLNRMQSAYFWEERNNWFSDVWDFKGIRQDINNRELRARSAAYPFELPFRLINMYSVFGDTVFDPFAGTGTTALAAMAAGRNSISCEIDSSFQETVKAEICQTVPTLNRHNLERIKKHYGFIRKYNQEGKNLKHANTYFKFPVMTGQESELKLVFIKSVAETEKGGFEISYFDDQLVQGLDFELLTEEDLHPDNNGFQPTFSF